MIAVYKSVALDTRAIRLARRAFGGLVAYDAFQRLGDPAFYLSDLGVLPRSLYYSFYEQSWAWSLYQLSGYPQFSIFLLIVTLALGVLHLAGRSRRATRILLWVLVLSVQNRNPAILDGTDDLLRLFLFWDMFLPGEDENPNQVVTWATLGFQLQLCLAVLLWAKAIKLDHLYFASQWGGRELSVDLVFLQRFVQGALAFFALSVWLKAVRPAALILVLPALVLSAYQLHPLFPLTVAAGALTLFPFRRKSDPSPEIRSSLSRITVLGLLLISITVLLLNFVDHQSVRRLVVPIGQAGVVCCKIGNASIRWVRIRWWSWLFEPPVIRFG